MTIESFLEWESYWFLLLGVFGGGLIIVWFSASTRLRTQEKTLPKTSQFRELILKKSSQLQEKLETPTLSAPDFYETFNELLKYQDLVFQLQPRTSTSQVENVFISQTASKFQAFVKNLHGETHYLICGQLNRNVPTELICEFKSLPYHQGLQTFKYEILRHSRTPQPEAVVIKAILAQLFQTLSQSQLSGSLEIKGSRILIDVIDEYERYGKCSAKQNLPKLSFRKLSGSHIAEELYTLLLIFS